MMKLYLTKQQALDKYPITEAELYNLIATATGNDVVLGNCGCNGDGEVEMIYNDVVAAYVAERDITPDKFKHLHGNLLGMNEASLKYGVSLSTIHKWIKRGELEIRDIDGLRKLIDEADIAYFAELSDAKRMRQGKKIFKTSGGD